MARVDEVIQSFVKNRVGGVIVINGANEIIYEDARIILSEKALKSFMRRKPELEEAGKTWEFSDSDNQKYYRVESSTVKMEEDCYQCHHFTDVSDYASLFQDISNYSRHIADVSSFQSNIMAKLAQPFESCLADLAGFCGSTKSVLYLEEDEEFVTRVSFYGKSKKERLAASEETRMMLDAKRFDMIDGYYCFLSDEIDGKRCAVYLMRDVDFNEEYFRDNSIYNVVRLYIENGLLRKKIIFDSEHDKLTGLYNKGKYLDMKSDDFGHPDKIAIFNMDINNLKKVNDNKGHEAGDRLIVKAASSVLSVVDDNVYGFRLGGDEFLIIAPGCSKSRGEAIYRKWKETLKRINNGDDDDCIIACGVVYGDGDYELDALLATADELMYKNKKEIKGI